jgi:hypothetical protein
MDLELPLVALVALVLLLQLVVHQSLTAAAVVVRFTILAAQVDLVVQAAAVLAKLAAAVAAVLEQ